MHKRSTSRGFTLIELLVVIAIIGLLSSVVLASLSSARSKGRDARRLADIKQLQVALELYYSENNEYAPTLNDLVTANLISAISKDPQGGSYGYAPSADQESYCLGTIMEANPAPAGASCAISGFPEGDFFAQP